MGTLISVLVLFAVIFLTVWGIMKGIKRAKENFSYGINAAQDKVHEIRMASKNESNEVKKLNAEQEKGLEMIEQLLDKLN
ncbi:hypothetical protein [Carboxylicivirga caseinilyticus]|uniref:hypothetical protein n=1 Tax=Carboxylicivirga caseinilyticus TaxID=3417572 RepID=UPI003D34436F|nr:hypothetical protein [Marinilabiliaceae bacterium A049]